MATLGTNVVSLLDIQKRLDKNDKIADIIELLNQDNAMVQDMTWVEGDSADGLTTSLRTGVPTPTWRLYNGGVQPTKSTVATVKFTCATAVARNEVDVDLAERGGNASAFRLQEAAAAVEGMSEEVQRALIYDNETTTPGRVTGLAAYYNSKSAESGDNIIDAGGTGSDNTSIYLVAWHPMGVTGIYPKGSKAGLVHEDHGKQLVSDAVGAGAARYWAYMDEFKWTCGLAVRDWRQAVRIANIDHSNLIADSSAADLQAALYKAYLKIKDPSKGRLGIYMRRDVLTKLGTQAFGLAKTGGGITLDTVEGKVYTKWMGIPIRFVDQLTNSEARVT